MSEHLTIRHFCAQCFADDRGGSWGAGVIVHATGNHCLNCGSSGGAVEMPQWAVDSIRSNASWVGKRYYPADEDRERAAELKYLRSVAPDPECTAVEMADEPGKWMVHQGRISTTVTAKDKADAKAQAKTALPHPH